MADPQIDLSGIPNADATGIDLSSIPDQPHIHEVLSDSTKKFLSDNGLGGHERGRADEAIFNIDTSKLHEWIRNNVPNVKLPFLPNMAPSVQSLAQLPVHAFDMLVGAAAQPENLALSSLGAAKGALKDIPITEVPPVRPIRGLLAERNPQTSFIAGPQGVVDAKIPNAQIYANYNPFGEFIPGNPGNTANLGELGEANRLRSLDFGAAEQYPGTRLKLPDKGINIPPESGDITGGFNPQSEADLPYPLNITPNKLRPRAVQSDVLRSGEYNAGVDRALNEPTGTKYTFNHPGFPSPDDIPELPVTEEGMKPLHESAISEAELERSKGYTVPDNPVAQNLEKERNATAPLDEVIGAPIRAKNIEETTTIQPGQARPNKDINWVRANVGSPDTTLLTRPQTAPIATLITGAQDEKMGFIATTMRQLRETSRGLGKQDRQALGLLIDHGADDIAYNTAHNISPDLVQRATKAREIFDTIHDMIPGGIGPKGEDVGYIENYLTHIAKSDIDSRSALGTIFSHYFGKDSPIAAIFKRGELGEVTGETGDILDKGLGNPSSPFTKTRIGMDPKDIEWDVNKIFPAYIQSIGKVIYDKPAVDKARELLKMVPESKLKELAKWYITNYSRYDSAPELKNAANVFVSGLVATTSRSLLGLNTGLQMLHAARIPANLFPELGAKLTGYGMMKMASNPIQSYREMVNLGLLQNEIKPFAFRTLGEKVDSIGNFFSVVDSLDKGIGYYGFKKKFLDMGMGEHEAMMNALNQTKRVSLTVDPARSMMGLANDEKMTGVIGKLSMQYKSIPIKIVEQYSRIAANALKEPGNALRAIAGVGLAVEGYNLGLHTFHVSPSTLVPSDVGGAAFKAMGQIATKVYKGDVAGALMDTALWLTPAGKSIQRQLQSGPSAFESEKQKKQVMRIRFR